MSAITTRAGKNAPLTNAEVDANFTNLNSDKAEKSITISAGAGLSGGGDLSGNRTLGLANSGVSAGSYGGNNSIPSITIDEYGRVTVAGTVTPSGTWGISISGNAATASAVPFSGVSGTPTTLSGYGITDAQATLVSGTNIKTINGSSVLGSGNIQIDGGVTSFNTRTGAVTLSSGDVTTALGYTPYNSTNPSGYITSSANITGSAGSLSNTTNYFINRGDVAVANVNTATGLGVWNQTTGVDSQTLLVFDAGGSTGTVQQKFSYFGSMEFRNRTDGANWTAWKTVLTNLNYNSYSPTLTGGGASGTWGINVSGNAATATTAANYLPLAGGTMTGLLATKLNTAGFTGANDSTFSVRGNASYAAAMSFHRTGAYAVNLGLDTDNVFKLGGWSAGGVPHYWDFGGTAYATAAMRAPIFYNINNTGYSIGFNDSVRVATPSGYIDIGPKNTGTCHIYSDRGSFYFNQPLLYVGRRVLNEDEWINSKYFGSDGNVYANASSRAPIFYDQNDTGYYCDPNSRSRLNALKLNTNSWITDSLDFNRIYFQQGDGTLIRGYSGTWYIQMGSSSTTTSIIEGNGNFYTTGAVTAYWSDARLKKNVQKINDWREILGKINGYRFEWNELGLKMMGESAEEERGIKVGLLAQEAKEALPQSAVVQLMQYESKTNGVLIPKQDINYDPENPYLTVQLEKYVPVLIEASKGLMTENDDMKDTIASLLARIDALEKQGKMQ